MRIVEERDLPGNGVPVPDECNAGVYVFSGRHLWPALERLSTDNVQGEYYLTDVVALLAPAVEAVLVTDPEEALGVNDRRQLAAAEAALRRRLLDALMLDGVTVEDPATNYVDAAVRVGADTVLRPMTVLRGATVIGRDCEIGPMAQIRDTRVGDRVRIGASVIDDAEIGHFNRVRPGSALESGVSLGTHAEVKNSRVGAGSRVNHFSCVLDSDVGTDVNIGAGTVTCNYDGHEKHRIAIEDGAFVGTNSSLVAPVRIGRERQRNIEGWRDRSPHP